MANDIALRTCTEGHSLAFTVDSIDPNIVKPFAAKDLLSLQALIWHSELKWIILVTLSVVATITKVSVEDVTTGIDFAVFRGHSSVMLASCYIDADVAVLETEEVVLNFKEVVDVIVSAHSGREHVFSVLTIEPDPVILRQNDSKELPMDDFKEIFTSFGDLNLSQHFLFWVHTLGTEAKAPNALISAHEAESLMHGMNGDGSTLS